MEQDQKSASSLKNSQSGQAVVEYVLLMVIIVALVIGVGKGFGTLNDYLNRYIGDYTACLMEYGELPSLGIKETELDRHSSGDGKKCNQQYAAFTFEGGRPSNSAGGGSGSKPGSNSNSNSGSGASAGKNAKSGAAGKSGNSSDGESDSTKEGLEKMGGGAGSKSPYKNGQIARSGSSYGTSDGGADDAQKVRVINIEDEEDELRKNKKRSFSINRSDYENSRYRPITGKMQQEYEKSIKNKIARAPSTSVSVANGDGNGLMPYKKQFTTRPIKPPAADREDNSKFGFGYFLRWILMAGMIIAIIIFFGGQIMNYSNSQD